MTNTEIRAKLAPFLEDHGISDKQAELVNQYLDLLLKWNARVNLTAIRDPDEILTRHFGESFFLARRLARLNSGNETLIDIGSGAGFPGIPIKIWIPEIHVTLIESRQKKATFLKEVVRTLSLKGLEVANSRAEEAEVQADCVAFRAVEKFEEVLPIAAELVKPSGLLALLIGSEQLPMARIRLPQLLWEAPIAVPLSSSRVVAFGRRSG